MSGAFKERIIVALDVTTADEARECVAELSPTVGAFKIGLQLFTSAGSDFVRELVEDGIKIFLDLKFHDIPATVAKTSVESARLGVWMFNVHSSGGTEMIRRTVESVEEVCQKENLDRPKIIGVTVLTSSDKASLRELGIEETVDERVLRLARISLSNGLNGVVASPRETDLIRQEITGHDFLVVTPGIRMTEVEGEDQKRVMTPGDAIIHGSDYLVIGRPILSAADKTDAVKQIITDIENRLRILA